MSIESIDNPIFTVNGRSIAISKDVSYEISSVIPAQANGSDSAANATLKQQTSFTITNSQQNPLDLNKCALSLDLQTQSDDGVPMTVTQTPSWNLFGDLISNIQVNINDESTGIINYSSDAYLYVWTAYMLHTYDFEALNNHPAICGPVALKYSETYNGKVNTLEGASKVRRPNYNGHFKLICPLRDVFLGMPAFVLANLRRISIIITWKSNQVLLEKAITAAGVGKVYIKKAEFLATSPVKTAVQQTQSVQEKGMGRHDLIAWSRPEYHASTTIANTDITITSVINLDKIMIFQMARDITRATKANNSTGQFYLFAKAGIDSATDVPFREAHAVQGLDSIQINYGQITYPQQPLYITQNNTNQGEQLYYEYCKACDVFAAKDVSPLPLNVFNRTMPFVSLKHSSHEAITLDNSAKDLIIRLRGNVANTKINIIMFTHTIFMIKNDGLVVSLTGKN